MPSPLGKAIDTERAIRNLGDGIDPNVQDATLVATSAGWVVAEFLRLHHNVTADEAQIIVEELVSRSAPIIEDFDGFLKLLNPALGAGDQCLVLLYQRGQTGAEIDELLGWVKPSARANLRRTLRRLVEELAFVHKDKDRFFITALGRLDVETRRLFELS